MSGKKKKRKKRGKNQLCFLVSVLFSRQNKRFRYFKHPLVIYSLTTQNVVHGPVALAFSVTLTEMQNLEHSLQHVLSQNLHS